jgi:hypothetical protein
MTDSKLPRVSPQSIERAKNTCRLFFFEGRSSMKTIFSVSSTSPLNIRAVIMTEKKVWEVNTGSPRITYSIKVIGRTEKRPRSDAHIPYSNRIPGTSSASTMKTVMYRMKQSIMGAKIFIG